MCILLLVNCVDLLPVQCIYFMTHFRRLCFATVSGVLWSPTLGAVKRDRWSLTTVVTSRLSEFMGGYNTPDTVVKQSPKAGDEVKQFLLPLRTFFLKTEADFDYLLYDRSWQEERPTNLAVLSIERQKTDWVVFVHVFILHISFNVWSVAVILEYSRTYSIEYSSSKLLDSSSPIPVSVMTHYTISSSSSCGLSRAGRCRSYELTPCLSILHSVVGGC